MKNEGVSVVSEIVLRMYSGLSANLLRQAAHTTTRLGICICMYKIASKYGYRNAEYGLATLTGYVSSFRWTPAEIAFIRMAADSRALLDEKRNYKNVVDAVIRIRREEGFHTLWRGALIPADYNSLFNTMNLIAGLSVFLFLATTRNCEIILNYRPSIRYASCAISGFVSAVIATPIDNIKTKVQNMNAVEGKSEYSDAVEVLTAIAQKDGISALWKGFLPFYARLVLHNTLTVFLIGDMEFQQLPNFPSVFRFS